MFLLFANELANREHCYFTYLHVFHFFFFLCFQIQYFLVKLLTMLFIWESCNLVIALVPLVFRSKLLRTEVPEKEYLSFFLSFFFLFFSFFLSFANLLIHVLACRIVWALCRCILVEKLSSDIIIIGFDSHRMSHNFWFCIKTSLSIYMCTIHYIYIYIYSETYTYICLSYFQYKIS